VPFNWWLGVILAHTHLWESLCSWFPVTQTQREGEVEGSALHERERESIWNWNLPGTTRAVSAVCEEFSLKL